MRFRFLLPFLAAMPATGCIGPLDRQPAITAPAPASSALEIYDTGQNLLAKETIPARGWTALNLVMREGRYDGGSGVFVKFNSNVRFLPWTDVSADPRGLRIFSDNFIQAGELTLRVTRAPCGGRLPLVFRLRELLPPMGSERPVKLETVAYEPLGNWTESGLFLPDSLIERIDDRWPEETCQPALSPEAAMYKRRVLTRPPAIQSASVSEQAGKTATMAAGSAERPCRLCRHADDHGERDHDRADHDIGDHK